MLERRNKTLLSLYRTQQRMFLDVTVYLQDNTLNLFDEIKNLVQSCCDVTDQYSECSALL